MVFDKFYNLENRNIGPFLAFGKEWFIKYQSWLLFFLNIPVIRIISRYMFRIEAKYNEPITELLPDKYNILQTNGTIKSVFFTHCKFSKRIYFSFRLWWWFLHGLDQVFKNNWLPEVNFGFDTLTAYSQPGANSPCDGYIYKTGKTSDFSVIATGDADGMSVTDAILALDLYCATTSGKFSELIRSFLNFDTSSINDQSTIQSVQLSLYCTQKFIVSQWDPIVHVVKSTANSAATLLLSDYDNFETTSFGSKNLSQYSINQASSIDFNSNGLSAINKTGITKLAIISNYDLNTSPPTWLSGNGCLLYWSAADATGTSNDPKLIVISAAPASYKTINGISKAAIKSANSVAIASLKGINNIN